MTDDEKEQLMNDAAETAIEIICNPELRRNEQTAVLSGLIASYVVANGRGNRFEIYLSLMNASSALINAMLKSGE